jgi:hypothetical protein
MLAAMSFSSHIVLRSFILFSYHTHLIRLPAVDNRRVSTTSHCAEVCDMPPICEASALKRFRPEAVPKSRRKPCKIPQPLLLFVFQTLRDALSPPLRRKRADAYLPSIHFMKANTPHPILEI